MTPEIKEQLKEYVNFLDTLYTKMENLKVDVNALMQKGSSSTDEVMALINSVSFTDIADDVVNRNKPIMDQIEAEIQKQRSNT